MLRFVQLRSKRVCVRERERETKRQRETERGSERVAKHQNIISLHSKISEN